MQEVDNGEQHGGERRQHRPFHWSIGMSGGGRVGLIASTRSTYCAHACVSFSTCSGFSAATSVVSPRSVSMLYSCHCRGSSSAALGKNALAIRVIFHGPRSEEHTSELQSLMRNSYAVFCLKKKKTHQMICKHKINLYTQQE